MFTQEEMDKLPKWSRDKIHKLLYYNRQLTINNQTLKKENPPSNTVISLENFEEMYVGNGTRVTFNGKDVSVTVNIDFDGIVRVDLNDGIILPWARNVIYISGRKNPVIK
jgi:hypothetical protein